METNKGELYKNILEQRQRISKFAEDFIFIIDNNFFIQYLNSHTAKHLGCLQKEVIGKPLSDLFPPNSCETLQQNLQIVFESGKSFSSENSIVFSNKKLWLDSRFTPIKENDEVIGVLVISRNIAERIGKENIF
jgi:PAS domain S-box-containing protein